MADLFQLSDLTVTDVASPSSDGATNTPTGDLRRKYAFGNQVSELAISQDPFFRFVSMVSKRPTDDPSFKFTERRGSYHKRYGYVTGWGATEGAVASSQATVTPTTMLDGAGDELWVQMKTDFKSSGNVQHIQGQSDMTVGGAGTKPIFFLPNQLVKIPFAAGDAADSAALAFDVEDYIVGRVAEVKDDASDALAVLLRLVVVRPLSSTGNNELAGWGATGSAEEAMDILTAAQYAAFNIHDQLERARCYVVGSAHSEGSGYPETWEDQPFTTGFGYTQIWKTSMAMTNTARATSLKYDSSEWARVWKEKLIEHKWDIEQSLLFGAQASNGGINYTQGAVDFILSKGNAFSWTTSKSQDDFLDDLSNYLDPRYNNGNATVFFVSTDVYNWLHKLGGYALSNMNADGRAASVQSRYNADLGVSGKKSVLGLGVSVINTVYGDMNIVRNIHLEGTHVKILACDMKQCSYRPLVGNGVDRDTAVYVGVQTLENSGVDRRVDLILTEAGMEFSMPEAHAVWTQG